VHNYRPFKVILIETHPKGQKGSMSRYGDMIHDALKLTDFKNGISAGRINLSIPYKTMRRFPNIYHSWIHHLSVYVNAAVRLPNAKADFFHITDGSHAYVTSFLSPHKTIATAHDVIPFLQLHEHFGQRSTSFLSHWLVQKSVCALRNIGLLFAVSNNTLRDLAKYADINLNKVKTVYHSIPASLLDFSLLNRPLNWVERRKSKKPFILHVGNDGFYKNRIGLFKIFSIVRASIDIQLKLVGPQPKRNENIIINDLGIRKYLEFITDIEDDHLFTLYQHACLFLYPSIYEGFGWPPLEAMALGCPVVCSNTASLPEVVGDAALTCHPNNEYEMATKCLSLLNDAAAANDLIERGYKQSEKFTPKEMAHRIVEGYQQVLF
jgi:glycosyltransferase involved in cell wall biosynthesis